VSKDKVKIIKKRDEEDKTSVIQRIMVSNHLEEGLSVSHIKNIVSQIENENLPKSVGGQAWKIVSISNINPSASTLALNICTFSFVKYTELIILFPLS